MENQHFRFDIEEQEQAVRQIYDVRREVQHGRRRIPFSTSSFEEADNDNSEQFHTQLSSLSLSDTNISTEDDDDEVLSSDVHEDRGDSSSSPPCRGRTTLVPPPSPPVEQTLEEQDNNEEEEEDNNPPLLVLRCFAPEGTPIQGKEYPITKDGATLGRKQGNTISFSHRTATTAAKEGSSPSSSSSSPQSPTTH
eukprot:5698345-Ditylum_brightwellii.AAC.1